MAALLAAGRRRVLDVWTLQPSDDRQPPAVASIEDAARARGVPVRRVTRDRLVAEARTSAPQGVLAHAEPLVEADLDDLLARRDGEPPFLLALDGVTDPQNLGALLRSAAAAGAGGTVLGRHRAVHVTPAAAKAAAGAVETLPLALVSGIPAALARARERRCWTVGLAPDGDTSLYDLELATEGILLVVGAEGEGMGALTRKRCDALVRIPMAEGSQSLNVAAAGTLALFEVRRRRERTR